MPILTVAIMILKVLGSLALFLYGMKVMSDGLQKAAGNRLQNTLNFMTKNRFLGVLTGSGVTALIQSSSATTVMVVSFANAGLITLKQSIGVIMGANIGTTITAWLVTMASVVDKFDIVQFNLIILAFMLPLMFSKRAKLKNTAEALIGLTIIFIGLYYLKKALPNIKDSDSIKLFIANLSGENFRFYHVLLFALVGTGLTAIVQSSSAVTAIAISLIASGLLPFQPVAALVIGSNIGTTITAMLASLGANTVAKRASLAHILFNIFGATLAIIFFFPFINLVEMVALPLTHLMKADVSAYTPFMTNGVISPELITTNIVEQSQNFLSNLGMFNESMSQFDIVDAAFTALQKKQATIQVSVFHTLFNVINTAALIGFVHWFAKLVEMLIPEKEGDELNTKYKLKYLSTALQDTPELNIQNAKAELMKMTTISAKMFDLFIEIFSNPDKKMGDKVERLKKKEDYTDQMQEEISRYLAECARENLADQSRSNINSMIRISHELESIGDSCFNLGLLTQRKYDKEITFSTEACDELNPFIQMTQQFLDFIQKHMNAHISKDELLTAVQLENDIDKMRSTLRKNARRRIQDGGNVKAELLYIDIVKHIEQIGDSALNVAQELRAIK